MQAESNWMPVSTGTPTNLLQQREPSTAAVKPISACSSGLDVLTRFLVVLLFLFGVRDSFRSPPCSLYFGLNRRYDACAAEVALSCGEPAMAHQQRPVDHSLAGCASAWYLGHHLPDLG